MEVLERPTLAQVFRRFYPGYRQTSDVTAEQRRAAWCIQMCRTPALGEDLWACDRCAERQRVYHSCGNRHCPRCQAMRSLAWLERQRARLLPVPYFHVVFTLPAELNQVIQYNRARLVQAFFACSAGVLQSFARDPRWLGAQPGFLGILHTWGQTLTFHPHIHYLVAQGGIDAQGHWVAPKLNDAARFLFPVQALSEVFRGRFLRRLERAHAAHQLRFPDPATESGFPDQLRIAASKRWTIYAQPPFASADRLCRYLSLYTHRSALSNGRLVQCTRTTVSFRYKDYRDQGREKVMKLGGPVLISRFLQHVVPRGMRRIRAYGFLANAAGRQAVQRLRQQGIGSPAPPTDPPDTVAPVPQTPPPWAPVCPRCKVGHLHFLEHRPPKIPLCLWRLPPDDTS